MINNSTGQQNDTATPNGRWVCWPILAGSLESTCHLRLIQNGATNDGAPSRWVEWMAVLCGGWSECDNDQCIRPPPLPLLLLPLLFASVSFPSCISLSSSSKPTRPTASCPLTANQRVFTTVCPSVHWLLLHLLLMQLLLLLLPQGPRGRRLAYHPSFRSRPHPIFPAAPSPRRRHRCRFCSACCLSSRFMINP